MTYLVFPYANAHFRFLRSGDSEPMITSLGFEWDTTTDPQDVTDDLSASWAGSTIQEITTQWTTFAGVQVVFGTADPQEPLTFESSVGSDNGDAGEQVCPPNTALLVKKLTARGGRKGRGRFYYPDVQEAAVDASGTIDSSSLAGYQTRWNDWMSDIVGVDGVVLPVLLHSESSDGSPDEILSTPVQAKVATQRRRLRP